MTKRELIEALEALDVPDDTPIKMTTCAISNSYSTVVTGVDRIQVSEWDEDVAPFYSVRHTEVQLKGYH